MPVDVTIPLPFRGERTIFPVVEPPMVRVLLFNACSVAVKAVRARPLPLVVAERVAVGAPVAIPVIANSALAVAVEPTSTSRVSLNGEMAPRPNCQ